MIETTVYMLAIFVIAAFIGWLVFREPNPEKHYHRYRNWVHRRRTETGFGTLYEVYIAHCEICGKPKSKFVKAG